MRYPVAVLATALIITASVLITYRVAVLGSPLSFRSNVTAWSLSFGASLKPVGDDTASVKVALPQSSGSTAVLEETVGEGSLDFTILREDTGRFAFWTGRMPQRGGTISYHATLAVRPGSYGPLTVAGHPPEPDAAAAILLGQLASHFMAIPMPDRVGAITDAAAASRWPSPPSSTEIAEWERLQQGYGKELALVWLFHASGVTSNLVHGLPLVQGIYDGLPVWVAVLPDQNGYIIDPATGRADQGARAFLPLVYGTGMPLEVSGATVTEARWYLDRQVMSQWSAQSQRASQSEHFLDRWSLFRLPVQFQETFRLLLLVPVGALVTSILRNIVGLPTFGIFMPVLMALAFRNTGLAYGLGIFAGVVLFGYAVRRAIDRLHLLLVPRLAFILTIVIAVFVVVALIGNMHGLRQLMAVGLLPFVILTMTIERFFIIMEESGASDALRTAAGTAAVATAAHEIIHIQFLQLSFFLYPELLLVVASLQLLIGRYTGYRLSEVFRFKTLRNPI